MVKELKNLIAQKELISSQITKEINKIIDIYFIWDYEESCPEIILSYVSLKQRLYLDLIFGIGNHNIEFK